MNAPLLFHLVQPLISMSAIHTFISTIPGPRTLNAFVVKTQCTTHQTNYLVAFGQ